MKKLSTIFLLVLFTTLVQAQVLKTIHVSKAGTLTSLLTESEKKTVTSLTITGRIDVRDFKIIRDSLPKLAVLDISGVRIDSYTGLQGTMSTNIKYPANSVPHYAFHWCTGLISIKIPSSIKSIGEGAFCNCNGLTSIEIPKSVTSISEFDFAGCTRLHSIEIPASVKLIADGAFLNCKGLTGSLIIPNSVKSIGYQAFELCSGLTSLVITNSSIIIEDEAFEGCSGLTGRLTIPNSITIRNKAEPVSYPLNSEPVFPGGEKELLNFIERNIRYPNKEKKKGIEGLVYIRFDVTRKGEIEYPVVIKGVSKLMDKEALRLVNSLPKFIPGKREGKKVKLFYDLAVQFIIKSTENHVYDVVEKMPQFPGGEYELFSFIGRNIKYPPIEGCGER